MTTTINASTSSGLVVTPDNSGNVLLQYNGQSAPAFSAYKTSDQSISSATWTKITYDSEEYDTNSNFASSRFTPTVAGYYQISWGADLSATSCTRYIASLYKNGTAYKYAGAWTAPSGTWEYQVSGSCVVYFNGSTDYVEIYAYITGTSPAVYSTAAPSITWFNGCLLRGA